MALLLIFIGRNGVKDREAKALSVVGAGAGSVEGKEKDVGGEEKKETEGS